MIMETVSEYIQAISYVHISVAMCISHVHIQMHIYINYVYTHELIDIWLADRCDNNAACMSVGFNCLLGTV